MWKSVLTALTGGKMVMWHQHWRRRVFPVKSGKCITSGSRTKPLGQLIVI